MDIVQVTYTNSEGFREFRKVPSYLHPSDYGTGILVGPPDISSLKLSFEDTLALNNALVDAGYVDYKSLAGKRRDLLILTQNILGITEEQAQDIRLKLIGIYQRAFYLLDEELEND